MDQNSLLQLPKISTTEFFSSVSTGPQKVAFEKKLNYSKAIYLPKTTRARLTDSSISQK